MTQSDADPELVAGLFEAALDPLRPLRALMDAFAQRLEVEAAYFKLVEGSGNTVLEGVGGGVREGSDRDYLDHYLATDVRVPRVADAACGSVLDDRALISRDELRRSAFHNEWLKKYEIGHLVHANIAPSTAASHVAIVTLAQARDRGEFTPAQLHAFALYVPYFVRAVQLRLRWVQAEDHQALLAGALDSLRGAALLVDRRARVRFANTGAEALFAAGDGIALRGDVLVLSDAIADRKLRQWLDAILLPQAMAAGDASAVVAARRPSGRAALRIEILPVPRSCSGAAGTSGPVSLVLINDPAAVAGQRAQLVRATFRLTPAEAALAVAVAEGETLRQCAERRGVAIGTVRSQMKAVLAKTGCRRQADLVRLFGGGQPI